MISSPTALPQTTNSSPKRKLKSLAKLLVVVVLLGVGGLFAIWHFGSKQAHKENKHPLYSTFEDSPEHKKLLTQLQKSKLSILSGKKEDGLIQFVQHYANKLSQANANKPVFLQDYNSDHFQYYQIARDVKGGIEQLLTGVNATGDWILLSQNGAAIPEEVINALKDKNPNGKLLVVTTSYQKVKGFKQFAFSKVKDIILEKSISKSFKVKSEVADILYDYFETPEKTFLNLVDDKFDQKRLLGESHRPLEGLSKEDKAILQTLCAKGVGKSKKESPKLSDFGVVFFDGSNHWLSLESILNYELGAGVNCKNTVATELIIKSAENRKQKEEEERKVKEEAEKKKEEERKAEQERKAQEAKVKEEQKRLQDEKKKQEQDATKAAKAAKNAPKGENKEKKAPKAQKADKVSQAESKVEPAVAKSTKSKK